MNYFDIIVLIPLAWFAYKGYTNGLIRELVSLIALIAGLYALRYSSIVEEMINNDTIPAQVYLVITFLIVLILVYILGKMAEKIIKLIIPSFVNKVAGALFGACKVVLIFSFILFFINTFDEKKAIITPEAREGSLTYPFLEPMVPMLKEQYDNWDGKEVIEEATSTI